LNEIAADKARAAGDKYGHVCNCNSVGRTVNHIEERDAI
jgi:hypothetical protein